MGPLSITTACLALLAAAGKTSVAITTFIRGCRDARADLTSISGELIQLQLVLELLKDETGVNDGRILPESLQNQILSIIKNCSAVIDCIDKVLQKHAGKAGAAKWVVLGKAEVNGLRMSLEAHRGSLSLVLELVSVSLSKAIKEDMTAVRTDVHNIKQDTSQIPNIMAELARLRAVVVAGDIPSATGGQNYVLEQYLDNLTSYAETICNDVVWDSDRSLREPAPRASPTPSTRPSPEPSPRPSHEKLRVPELTTGHTAHSGYQGDNLFVPSSAADAVEEGTQTTRVSDQAGMVAALGPPHPDHSDIPPSKVDDIERLETTSSTERTTLKQTRSLYGETINVLVVGDAVGKTALIGIYITGSFPKVCVPTVIQKQAVNVALEGELFMLDLWDTSGVVDDDQLRCLLDSYSMTDVIMICFGIDRPDSLVHAKEKWAPRIKKNCPHNPIILVGLRKDLRHDPNTLNNLRRTWKHPVTWEEGHTVSREIGACGYFETSAKMNEGVKEVFKAATRLRFLVPKREKRHGPFRNLFRIPRK